MLRSKGSVYSNKFVYLFFEHDRLFLRSNIPYYKGSSGWVPHASNALSKINIKKELKLIIYP